MDTFAEVRQSDVMNLAEKMEHVEMLDQKFLQKIFDRIDVNKKGGCEFQMLHPCFCTEKMVKTENKKHNSHYYVPKMAKGRGPSPTSTAPISSHIHLKSMGGVHAVNCYDA